MINNNFINDYLSSSENLYSSVGLNDNIELYDSKSTIFENSIFISVNDNSENLDSDVIFGCTGRDSLEVDDEVSKLFSTFSKDSYFNEK